MATEPVIPEPSHIFDGGDLDCGSGLVLILRENMLRVPVGEILELRSREPTVGDDLPPWCRMVGHEYLGAQGGDGCTRYFVRRGGDAKEEEAALAEDKEQADEYEWRLRVRSSGALESTVYCRSFSWTAGAPASMKDKDKHPSALEYLLGSLASDLAAGFATECARSGLEVDDIEISVRGRLASVLTHLGLEEGDPSLEAIDLKCFASTFDEEAEVRDAWNRTVTRSPVCSTLRKAVEFEPKLAIV